MSDLQVLAGTLDSTCWEEAVSRVIDGVRALPSRIGPLAWWTVRGLAVDAIDRLAAGFGQRLPFELEFRRAAARATSPDELADVLSAHTGAAGPPCRSLSSGNPRVQRALDYIWSGCTRSTFGLEEVAKHAGLSRWHLSRLILRHTGRSFRDLVRYARMTRAQLLLLDGVLTMKEIAAAVGYAYATEFDRQFHRTFGTSPTDWRLRRAARW